MGTKATRQSQLWGYLVVALGLTFNKLGIPQAVATLCKKLPPCVRWDYDPKKNPIFNLMDLKVVCKKNKKRCERQLNAACSNITFIKSKQLAPREVARMREEANKLTQILQACNKILACTKDTHLKDSMFLMEDTSSNDLMMAENSCIDAYDRMENHSDCDRLEVYHLRLGQYKLTQLRSIAYKLQYSVYTGMFFDTKMFNTDYSALITVSELCQKIDTCWKNSLEMKCINEVKSLKHVVDDLFSQMKTVGRQWLHSNIWILTWSC
jgi:hypothetical protein